MSESLPANFRNRSDVKYGHLKAVDVPAELRENDPWFNQTLTKVNDAVVRLKNVMHRPRSPRRSAVLMVKRSVSFPTRD